MQSCSNGTFLGAPLLLGMHSSPPQKKVNSKIKLALAAASAAGAASALIGQIPAALAGPVLTGNTTQTYNAGADYSLQFGQSFEAIGSYDGLLTPFAVTENVSGIQNVPVAGVPNAGTSTLTAAFDSNGFANTSGSSSTSGSPSFAVQAAIIQLGGTSPTGFVTTSATPALKAGLTLGLVLNQDTGSGIPSITLQGAGTPGGVIGASINTEAIGAIGTTGSLSNSLTVINSLSAFN